MPTQVLKARRGIITEEMEVVAQMENKTPEYIRERVANGRIVIPSGNDVLHVHDDVIVVTTDTTLQDIHDIISE